MKTRNETPRRKSAGPFPESAKAQVDEILYSKSHWRKEAKRLFGEEKLPALHDAP